MEDADEDSQFTACNTCRQIMLRENLNASTSANLTISQEGQNMGRFFCSGNVLNSLLESLSSTKNYNIEQSVEENDHPNSSVTKEGVLSALKGR